ncbi:MAG: DotU family type IV/VI secretion system protein [Nitrospirota bacterium]|nr:DotU family type IV/VI secretion system protein [Nitrospirota bacterium]
MMTLSDCLISVVANVKYLLDHSLGDLESVRGEILDRIEQARSDARSSGIDDTLFGEGLFPVVAWIDESLMCSNWSGAMEWRQKLLQKAFFGIANAGTEFYRRMPISLASDPAKREVLTVYYMVLQMGFEGQYGLRKNEHELVAVRKHLHTLLAPDGTLMQQKYLLPGAYPPEQSESTGQQVSSRKSINSVLLWSVPSVIVLLLFFIYGWIVQSMAHNVVGHIN